MHVIHWVSVFDAKNFARCLVAGEFNMGSSFFILVTFHSKLI